MCVSSACRGRGAAIAEIKWHGGVGGCESSGAWRVRTEREGLWSTGPMLVKMASFSRRNLKACSMAPKLTSPRPTYAASTMLLAQNAQTSLSTVLPKRTMSLHAASAGSLSETMLQAETSASGRSNWSSTPGGASARRSSTWPLCGPRTTSAITHAASSVTESLRASGAPV